jgi:hypothetical protein
LNEGIEPFSAVAVLPEKAGDNPTEDLGVTEQGKSGSVQSLRLDGSVYLKLHGINETVKEVADCLAPGIHMALLSPERSEPYHVPALSVNEPAASQQKGTTVARFARRVPVSVEAVA